MDLQGKTALVTGSSRGIGRAIAFALGAEGCKLAINYRSSDEAAAKVVAELSAMGVEARPYRADISDDEQAGDMLVQLQEDLGTVQILVNNAGITRDKSFLKMTREQWREVLLVNLDGPFNVTHGLLPNMVKSGWGRIINITSIVAQMGNFGQTNYAVAKGGMIAFTKTLAREVAVKGVTVNAVAPGFIETDMTAGIPPEALEMIKKMTPMGRLGRPEEVARAVRFLAAPQASFITGQVININGGLYM